MIDSPEKFGEFAKQAGEFIVQNPVSLGMFGALWIFMFAPPGRPVAKDATPEQKLAHKLEARERGREVGMRMLSAGLASHFVGTWLNAVLNGLWPWLQLDKYPAPVLFLCGAIGWYFGRALWLLLERRKNKDLAEQVTDGASVLREMRK